MADALSPDIWAKSPRGQQAIGESLHQHTERVVQRLAQLRERLPNLPAAVEDPHLWRRAFWACVLHDVGKAAAPFQEFLRGKPFWIHRHEIASLAFLPWAIGDDAEDLAWAGAAIASHHRDASVIQDRYPLDLPDDWAMEKLFGGFSDAVLSQLRDWLRTAPALWASAYGFDEGALAPAGTGPTGVDGRRFRAQAGPAAVQQVLASYELLHGTLKRDNADSAANRRALACRGLMLLADRLASAHAKPLDILQLPEADLLFKDADGNVREPRDYQRLTGAAPRSVVVSAPTGSGKTEAALWWASSHQAAEPSRQTLIYLLPYQASLNAMQQRLKKALPKQTAAGNGRARPSDVGLLHGHAAQALYRMLLADGYGEAAADHVARRAVNLARLQHPAVRVATPYQLLRAAYKLPGYEMLWTSLHGALVIVDEVHAYDAHRLGLFLGLLRRLVERWDVQVCALTATMPDWLRTLLVERLGADSVQASAADFERFGRHTLQIKSGDLPSALPFVAERVRAGEAALVAANTVAGAQAAYATLERALGAERVRLLHSRFTGRDRQTHEHELMKLVGLKVEPRTPVAVVATQTIEVSLNLDFDTIVSEPAPLEALAQRFGRVNRTGRLRRAPVYVLTEPNDGQGVYKEQLVQRTLAVLADHDGQPIDEAALGAMLDRVYGDGLAEQFVAKVQKHADEFAKACLRDLRAFQSDEALAEKFDELFDGMEVVPVSLEAEFSRRLERQPLRAQELLVPISYRQFGRLRREQRVTKLANGFHVVDVPYDSHHGLRLTAQPDEETP